jgi:hypothetical protein
MFGNEIEEFHQKHSHGVAPPNGDDPGDNTNANIAAGGARGSKKRKTTATTRTRKGTTNNTTTTKTKGNGAGSKNQSKNAKSNTTTVNIKNGTSLQKAVQDSDDDNNRNKMMEKDVYYAFGEIIQLAYRWQPLSNSRGYTSSHKTILFHRDEEDVVVVVPNSTDRNNNNNNNNNEKDSKTMTTAAGPLQFVEYIKLSHRLLVWMSKATDHITVTTDPDPIGFGFVRPEMIPISSLFRKPKELLDDDDDDGP